MKRNNRIVSGLTLAALSFLMAGCAKEKPADTAAAPTSGGTGGTPSAVKIAFIPKGNTASFWQTMKAGADKAAAEDKVTVAWQAPAKEGGITEQINVVQTQAGNGVNGMVLVATDGAALVKPAEDVIAKGIPVVTVDSGINKDIAACYIATDNVKGGRLAAQELTKAIGDKGNVGMLFFLKGAVSNDEREKGFKEELAKHPNVKLVAEQQAGDASTALNKATNMMTAHSDIVGIYAVNEPNGIGAANYLRQNKLTGKIKLVAFDSAADEITALNEGIIDALIVQDPYQMGYLGVKTALKAVRKEPIPTKFLDSGVTVVTKANIQTPDVQKLLDPSKR